MKRGRGFILWAVMAALALPVTATGEEPAAAAGGAASARPDDGEPDSPAGARHDLAGRWTLDPERSESIVPLMELMGAPWVARQFARTMRPTMEISLVEGGIRVVNDNPVRPTDRVTIADGQRRSSRDALDREVVEWAEWQDDGSLRIWREIHPEDGPPFQLEARWRRVGEVVTLDSEGRAPGEDTVRVRRVFASEGD